MHATPIYKVISITPTIGTAAYDANDTVGGVQTLAEACKSGRASKLASLSVLDKSGGGAALTLFFFTELPTLAADGAAFSVTDADMLKCKGHVTIGTGDYQVTAANEIACIKNIGLILESGAQGSLFVGVMTTGTPTYTATTDLVFNYSFEQGE